MNSLRTAGILWVVVALFSIGITLTFRIDPAQVVVTIAAGVVAAVLGLWLVARPTSRLVSASTVVAVAWAVLYTVLTVQQLDDPAAWTTDVLLIAVGAAAGVVAYRAAASAKLGGTIS